MNTKSEVSGPARPAVRPAGPPPVTGHGGPSSCTSGVRPPPLSLVMRAPTHRGLHPRDLSSPPAPPPDSTTWRIQQRPRGDSALSTAPHTCPGRTGAPGTPRQESDPTCGLLSCTRDFRRNSFPFPDPTVFQSVEEKPRGFRRRKRLNSRSVS